MAARVRESVIAYPSVLSPLESYSELGDHGGGNNACHSPHRKLRSLICRVVGPCGGGEWTKVDQSITL